MNKLLKNFLAFGCILLTIISCKKDIDNKPKADFTYTSNYSPSFPESITTVNTSTGTNNTYIWTNQANTSTEVNPSYSFSSGGRYSLKLVVNSDMGSDSIVKQVRISPFSQNYTSFLGAGLNLTAWERRNIVILSRDANLNRATMYKWLTAMDTAYGFLKLITGVEPAFLTRTYINERVVIADVPSTCSPANGICGSFGVTGLEIVNSFFDYNYNAINNNNEFDEGVFYELSRNFWVFSNKLSYKINDEPIASGFSVFMRFITMEVAGVNGAPYTRLSIPLATLKQNIENLVDSYMADASLNWANTLGANKGVPNSGLNATDLFASFCFRLSKNYGGTNFVKNLWKQAGLRPNANSTQDAVDNFFLAACAAANKNLTSVFQTWKWNISASAKTAATKFP